MTNETMIEAGKMMGMGMPTIGMGMQTMPMPSMQGMMMPGMGMMMMPKCDMTMEMVDGGCCIKCVCDDEMTAKMMQNMCMMMQGGMCSMMCMMNGMCVCACNMAMGACTLEMMDMGCMMTCTSGDSECAKMLQACCQCMVDCMSAGCCCVMTMNGMPMCCSC